MDDWKSIRKRKLEKDEEKSTTSKQQKTDEIIILDDSEPEDDQKKKNLPVCSYGSECYRKNPTHLAEFNHPKAKTEATTSKKKIAEPNNNAKSVPNFIQYSKVSDVRDSKKINEKNSMSLNDILSIDKEKFVESAQFNYCHDIDWTIQQYPKENRTKSLTIIHGPTHATQMKQMAKPYSNVLLCTAKLDIPYGTHHTKMMFLMYTNGMRVVVHTANLIPEDWHQKSQGIWISELFPRILAEEKPAKNMSNTDSKTNFKKYLMMYLEHYENTQLKEWSKKIADYDMKSANVFLIGSIPGRFPASKKLFGHIRLKKILSDHASVETDESANKIICQFSSIGSLGPNNEMAWLSKEFSSSLSSTVNPQPANHIKPICIFPSVTDVRNSYEGYSAGMSIPYSIKTAQRQMYLNEFFYHWKADSNYRTKAAPHIKTYARYSDNYKKMYWFLLTSANLSKAAWGAYDKYENKLFIRSYELGVLFLPKFYGDDADKCSFDLKTNSKFTLPYDLPPVKYDSNEKSWCYDVSYEEEDSHGRIWNVSSR